MDYKLFELITKMYYDMTKQFTDMKDQFREINKKLDEKADKKDVIRLENEFKLKVRNLFDDSL